MVAHFIVVTYNRPGPCLDLLEDIARETKGRKVTVSVYDDHSYEDYSKVTAFVEEQGWKWHSFPENHGKKQFWKLMTSVLQAQKRRKGEWFFLQDDLRLCEGFMEKTYATWNALEDPNKGTLLLLRDKARLNAASWTGLPVVPGEHADNVGWVDCIFFCTKRALSAIKYQIPKVPPARWDRNPSYSSGVGSYLSRTFKSAKIGMYRPHESLVIHLPVKSQMHPEHRLDSNMTADNFADGEDKAQKLARPDEVWACMASIPSRRGSMEKVVASLLPQVDKLGVYLNGYDEVPDFLDQPKIVVRHDKVDTKGDRAKFDFLDVALDRYYLSCDDDIIYPVDYVEKVVKHLEGRDRAVVVGCHGRLLNPGAAKQTYYNSAKVLSYGRKIAMDTPVQILGTGVMAFHTSKFVPDVDAMEHPNMADVYVAVQAKKARMPMVCIRHGDGWLKTVKEAQRGSIWSTRKNDDKPQTELLHANLPWPALADPLPTFGGPKDIGAAKVDWRQRFKRRRNLAVGPVMGAVALRLHLAELDKAVLSALKPRGSVLDYGCGYGRMAKVLDPVFDKYVGTDICEEMLDYRSKYNITGDFRLMTSSAIPAKDGEFNTVVCVNVLGDCADDLAEAAIKEWHRVLKSGGQVVLVEQIGGARRKVLSYQKMFPQLGFRQEVTIDGVTYAILVGATPRKRRRL